ncbi:hypothetical protein [Heyndrickxia acidiproducens]|uniref:hypothetical protein n=1 Tax=Heyndrickxia acidiproducens TaxID=1121084 RepID=UPI0003714363|nr:hypothetical protein [Heyndrickxia acidiproducens]
MNRQKNGMISSLVAVGATGMAIYGISRAVRNRRIKQMMQSMGSAITGQAVKQMAVKPIQGMMKPVLKGTGMQVPQSSQSGSTASVQS